jgi:hypothetical protein
MTETRRDNDADSSLFPSNQDRQEEETADTGKIFSKEDLKKLAEHLPAPQAAGKKKRSGKIWNSRKRSR